MKADTFKIFEDRNAGSLWLIAEIFNRPNRHQDSYKTDGMRTEELRHFFKLRLCGRAQWEIRELASKMYKIVLGISPGLFKDCGPTCILTGKCPEKNSCGRDRDHIINRIAMEAER